jgi:HSP90 family molecular chaperone
MERVMKAQALRDERYFRSDQKHVMEINARHPLIKKLLAVVEAGTVSSHIFLRYLPFIRLL